MLLAIEIIGIIVMCTVLIVSVWGLIVLKKVFGQLRYKNYLMEKLVENIHLFSTVNSNSLNTRDIKKDA